MTDTAQQRTNMVESQIRPSDVTDRRVLRAMQAVPREQFVPASLKTIAYMDDQVPLMVATGARSADGRSLMSPRTLAKLLQAADIKATDRVLVVGAGLGYSAAVLAQIAQSVVALECDSALADAAKATLAPDPKVSIVTGALNDGATAKGPYDVILLEGAVTSPPSGLLKQLAAGGRMVGVLQEADIGGACRWQRTGDHFGQHSLFEATLPILPGFARNPSFVF
jgi:protein-L-isoaspartate(D-aspartate) O-methyltransferase